jgi:SAM-dependent methyltransferase
VGASSHYDERYYSEIQAPYVVPSGLLNRKKFARFLQPSDTVVDFGCGPGGLLQGFELARKIGVEPNPHARAAAERAGLEVYADATDLPSEVADAVVSNHALEHALHPLAELVELARALKPGGQLILWVPFNDWRGEKNRAGDPDHHLYTWTPLLLRNLLGEAGFVVEETRVVTHAWPPGFPRLLRLPFFDELCWVTAKVRNRRQVFALARRPA